MPDPKVVGQPFSGLPEANHRTFCNALSGYSKFQNQSAGVLTDFGIGAVQNGVTMTGVGLGLAHGVENYTLTTPKQVNGVVLSMMGVGSMAVGAFALRVGVEAAVRSRVSGAAADALCK